MSTRSRAWARPSRANLFPGDADEFRVATPASSRVSVPKPGVRFVARQPILTGDEKVFGYELLFRDGVDDYFRSTDSGCGIAQHAERLHAGGA